MFGKKIVVVDYDMGNTYSILNSLEFLGYKGCVSRDIDDIKDSDALILPGVGSFFEAMKKIESFGLKEILQKSVLIDKKPILGICLGMQIMAKSGQECGLSDGLGFFDAKVKLMDIARYPLPHVGFNSIEVLKKEPLFTKIDSDTHFYFDHSFEMECYEDIISSISLYEKEIVASVQKENIFATQFHPEKSQDAGLKLLRGFLNYMESCNA